jgi:hypothetical protein
MRSIAAFAVSLFAVIAFGSRTFAVDECQIGEGAVETAGGYANAVGAAVKAAPDCEKAYKTLAACALNSSADNALSDIVQSKCEPLFMGKASRLVKMNYKKALDRCNSIAENNEGSMHQGFAAVCRAGASRDYARKYSGKH